MSKYIVLFGLLMFGLHALQYHTLKEAQQLQRQNKKPIMLYIMQPDCHYCQDMQRDVFDDKAMSQWLSTRFLAVKMNLVHDTLPFGLTSSFTPTFFFIDEKQNVLKKIPGAWNIEDFKSLTGDIK